MSAVDEFERFIAEVQELCQRRHGKKKPEGWTWAS